MDSGLCVNACVSHASAHMKRFVSASAVSTRLPGCLVRGYARANVKTTYRKPTRQIEPVGIMATDAAKNGRLRALAFNDPSLLTATANDVAYDEVFSLPLERLGRAGDLVIAISSSGNSPNIVRALDVARRVGIAAVTLSAMRPDNQARALGDLNFYVPVHRYGWAESAHQVILHHWFDQYLDLHGSGAI